MPSERPAAPDATERPSTPPGPASESEYPSSPPPSDMPPGEKRGRFERRLPNLIRRGIEKGIEAGLYTFEKSMETGRETTDAVREVFSEVKIPDVASAVGKALQEAKLPREIAGAVLGQIDETKNDVVRIIAREVRDFLEATDLAGEIKAALTSLSFEVRTEVRFIPNDAGTGVRPEVRSRSAVKRAVREQRRRAAVRVPDQENKDDDH
ncbi:MAG TPA: hypothetical protein VI299_16765 [Polyangiales bacterium]